MSAYCSPEVKTLRPKTTSANDTDWQSILFYNLRARIKGRVVARMYIHTLGREEWSLEKYFASVSDGTPFGEGVMPSTLPLGPQSQEGEIAKEFLE